MNMNPSKEEREYVWRSLCDFNDAAVGKDNHSELNITECDSEGNVIGGLLGGTYWGWLYVEILWIKEEYRKTGIGTRLLKAAECEAVARGCHHAHVETKSWQAPKFYENHGYELLGIMPDIPKGNQKYIFIKTL